MIDWDSPTWGKPGHNVHVPEGPCGLGDEEGDDDG